MIDYIGKINQAVTRRLLMVLVVGCVCLSMSASAADYRMDGSAIGSQGGPSQSNSYQLDGLSGQAVAGLTVGKERVLSAGFWAGNYGCTVNLTDLALFAEVWLSSPQAFGFNLEDFSVLASYWFCQCPADWPLK